MSGILAELLVLIHFGFILFVVLGGLLLLRWPWVAWIHLPAAAWGAYVEFAGKICPLTPLEQHLRQQAADSTYSGGFIEHYIAPIVYPQGLTREIGILLGVGVIVVNLVVYAAVIFRRRRNLSSDRQRRQAGRTGAAGN